MFKKIDDIMVNSLNTFPISLAYAPTPTENIYLELEVTQGTRIIDALAQSNWLKDFPLLNEWCQAHINDTQINQKDWCVGIFSHKKPLNYVLQSHDRIEIYRPLTVDPMRKRERRANLK